MKLGSSWENPSQTKRAASKLSSPFGGNISKETGWLQLENRESTLIAERTIPAYFSEA